MKPIVIVGIVLIIVGIVMLAAGGITYTDKEKVIDLGPIEATAEREKTIPLSPLAGSAAVVAGVVLVITGARRRSVG